MTTPAPTATAPTLDIPKPLPVPEPGKSLRERAAEAKQKLDAHTGVPALLASWGMAEGSDKLGVDVVGNDTTLAKTFLIAAGIDPATVDMRTGAGFNRPFLELVGGDAIYSGPARCSLGVNAHNKDGHDFVLTAGHCTKNRKDWSGYNKEPIGQTKVTNYPGDDFGAIAVTNDKWHPTSKVKGGPDIKGAKVAKLGSKVCRSGSTTGYRCGVVQAYDQTVNYGLNEKVFGLTKTNACAEPGDSGGTFITPAGQAQGFTSGGSGDCKRGGTTYFQPLKEALHAYGLSLYTH